MKYVLSIFLKKWNVAWTISTISGDFLLHQIPGNLYNFQMEFLISDHCDPMGVSSIYCFSILMTCPTHCVAPLLAASTPLLHCGLRQNKPVFILCWFIIEWKIRLKFVIANSVACFESFSLKISSCLCFLSFGKTNSIFPKYSWQIELKFEKSLKNSNTVKS